MRILSLFLNLYVLCLHVCVPVPARVCVCVCCQKRMSFIVYIYICVCAPGTRAHYHLSSRPLAIFLSGSNQRQEILQHIYSSKLSCFRTLPGPCSSPRAPSSGNNLAASHKCFTSAALAPAMTASSLGGSRHGAVLPNEGRLANEHTALRKLLLLQVC